LKLRHDGIKIINILMRIKENCGISPTVLENINIILDYLLQLMRVNLS